MDLKKINYLGNHLSCDGRIAYILDREKCIFSSLIHSSYATSSINAAESIIAAIWLQENLSIGQLQSIQFYDLMTDRGYTDILNTLPKIEKLSFIIDPPPHHLIPRALRDKSVHRMIIKNLTWKKIEITSEFSKLIEDYFLVKETEP